VNSRELARRVTGYGFLALRILAVILLGEFLIWRLPDANSYYRERNLAKACSQVSRGMKRSQALALVVGRTQLAKDGNLDKISIGGWGDHVCVIELDDTATVTKAYLVQEESWAEWR
jgi:hypothetical protein